MILRCKAPRKRDRFRACGHWLAAAPDGSQVLRLIRAPREAHPENLVLGCDKCHALYEVTLPLRKSA